MKNLLFIFLVQFTIAIALAQITFTREWVTGKRSFPYTSPSKHQPREHICSKSLLPAIKYLIEVENSWKESCGIRSPHLLQQSLTPSRLDLQTLPWSLNEHEHLSKDEAGSMGMKEEDDNTLFVEPGDGLQKPVASSLGRALALKALSSMKI